MHFLFKHRENIKIPSLVVNYHSLPNCICRAADKWRGGILVLLQCLGANMEIRREKSKCCSALDRYNGLLCKLFILFIFRLWNGNINTPPLPSSLTHSLLFIAFQNNKLIYSLSKKNNLIYKWRKAKNITYKKTNKNKCMSCNNPKLLVILNTCNFQLYHMQQG